MSNPTIQNQTTTATSAQNSQKNPKQNRRFQGKPTGTRTGSTSNKANPNSRNAKRARWAKKNKPTPRPVVKRGPVNEYVCECHGEPARKPQAGAKDVVKDPESGKMKDKPKGLGKWRCATTGKITKVSPRKPQPKEVPQGNFSGLKIDPYPAKLQTPVLEVPVAKA